MRPLDKPMGGCWRAGASALVAGAIWLGAPSAAWADALPAPPACPPGSIGRGTHGGTWCAPAPCQSDADCVGVEGTCRPWRVCTRSSQVSGGRQIEHTNEQAVVVGTCDPARACTGEEEPPPPLAGAVASGAPRCSNGNYCVPKPLPPLPPLWSSAPPTGSARDDGNEPGTAPTTPPGTRRGGCGCRLGPADTPLPAWSAGLVLVVALLARRRP